MQTKTISRRKFVLGASMGAALAACAAPIKTLTVKTPEINPSLSTPANDATLLTKDAAAAVPFASSAAWQTSYQTDANSEVIVQSYLQDTASWEQRWLALSAAIDDLRETLRPDMPRYNTLVLILNQLQVFGAQQYTQLSGALAQQTAVADGESHTSALHAALDQIAYDIQIVERAIYERLAGSPSIKASLVKTDAIVAASLQPAIDAGLFAQMGSTPTVITYFMKNPSIRVIPYASVVLVGIPYSAANIAKAGGTVTMSRDLLAIPHEVGHFVYWHGEMMHNGRSVRIVDALPQMLQEKYGNDFPKWMLPWLEETFADVYGGLVAGPLSALEFQDMALVHSRDELLTDDGDHPLHAMRSDIFIQLMRNKMGLNQWADTLQTRWQALRDNRLATGKGNQRFNAFVPATDQSPSSLMALSPVEAQKLSMPVSLAESRKFSMVLEVLDDVITRVYAKTNGNWWRKAYEQTQPTTAAKVAERLYTAFDQHARQDVGLASTQTLDSFGNALKQEIQLRAWKLEGPQSPQTGSP